jgi:hypothetical protein
VRAQPQQKLPPSDVYSPPMDLETRLVDLHESLEGMGGAASWQTAQIFNALLQQVKETYPDDPVVAVIEPVQRSAAGSHSTSTNLSLRTATQQLLSAVKGY